MDLYLIRHGETAANTDGVIQGWTDTELGETGRQQAKTAAQSFTESIDAIYSSDLQRATQTAQQFRSQQPGAAYSEDDRLRERSFGEAVGTRRDEFDWTRFWSATDEMIVSGAETLAQYDQRIKSFLDELRQSGFYRVLIVTHDGTINRINYLMDNSHQHRSYPNAEIMHLQLV